MKFLEEISRYVSGSSRGRTGAGNSSPDRLSDRSSPDPARHRKKLVSGAILSATVATDHERKQRPLELYSEQPEEDPREQRPAVRDERTKRTMRT
jgi:hypothetical protein